MYGNIQNLGPAFRISGDDTTVANSVVSGLVSYSANSHDICNDLAESIEQSEEGQAVLSIHAAGTPNSNAAPRCHPGGR